MTPKRRVINLSWFFLCLCFSKSLLIKVNLLAMEIHTQIRNSVWELKLPHVLQRFVGTNFLTEVILFNNLPT